MKENIRIIGESDDKKERIDRVNEIVETLKTLATRKHLSNVQMEMLTLCTKDEFEMANRMTATKFKEVEMIMDSKITETQIMA